jgi:hypothetical protein
MRATTDSPAREEISLGRSLMIAAGLGMAAIIHAVSGPALATATGGGALELAAHAALILLFLGSGMALLIGFLGIISMAGGAVNRSR